MAGGKDADMAALAASHDALLKFVYEVTNRGPDELQFGEVRSFTEFRYVQQSVFWTLLKYAQLIYCIADPIFD